MPGSNWKGYLYAASKDILAIEGLLWLGADVHSEAIAFHSQQAAEKIVKNIFVCNGEIPPKTHCIDELLGHAIGCGWIEADADCINAATNLSYHAVSSRYAQMPDITEGEALQAVIECNSIASTAIANGYECPHIECDARFMRDDAIASGNSAVNGNPEWFSRDSHALGNDRFGRGADDRGLSR